ncbi:glucosamine-6-phosphate deaminase [Paenibacillus sp. LMG 31456]|uniref:Glucosamine-6-phosphate deaminase n=2 Tax=Paenibacillus foliorum TaxID=2654974 RepID=A0A972GWA9_9BACL|nr:glucosamine-6-phosphate deaminase [Paenibacillus foliorum]
MNKTTSTSTANEVNQFNQENPVLHEGNLHLTIVKNEEEMSQAAAELVHGQLAQRPNSVLGLATGGTPIGMYRQLCRNKADLSKATTFNLDEYYELPRHHPQSFFQFMKEHVYDPLLPLSYDIPNGEAANVEQECVRYETAIRRAGGIDLQVLGVGRNGHIGFNEPGTPFLSRTRLVALKQETVEDNARFFGDVGLVPTQAITMGIGTILEAKAILLLASGAVKAKALHQLLYGDISPGVPVTALRLHPAVRVIVDEEAASLLERLSD